MKFVKQVFLFGAAAMSQDVCQDHCVNTPTCLNEEHQHGSYCKSWQNPPVCFGLYWIDSSRTQMCFEPAEDGACGEAIPVEC